MSLESTIAENTAAILALTAALTTRAGAPDTLPSTPSTKRMAKKAVEPAATSPAQIETSLSTGADPYTAAAKAITELSRLKGRDAALKVLARFDATKLPGVAQDRLAEVAEAARQALEASE